MRTKEACRDKSQFLQTHETCLCDLFSETVLGAMVMVLLHLVVLDIVRDAGDGILVGGAYVVSDELISVRDRLDGSGVLVEDIDLLEGETLGLGDAEVGEDETADASRTPDEEHFWTEVSVFGVNDIRGSIADTKVPEPVGGGGKRHGLGTNGEREDFRGDDPGDGTPGGGEEGDVDADESDEDLLAGLVADGNRDTDDGNEVLADQHAGRSDEEEATATDVVDGPERGDGHTYVDNVGGDSDQEWVSDARVLEEGRSVVEDEVDTGERTSETSKDKAGKVSTYPVSCCQAWRKMPVKVRKRILLGPILKQSA